MTAWEKFISDPEYGDPRHASPCARFVVGLICLIMDVVAISSGKFQLGRGVNPNYLYYRDHPRPFVLLCMVFAGGMVWAFWNARKRYLMHDD